MFCGAYKGFLFSLYVKYLGNDITIITYHKDIIKYCQSEKIKHIAIDFIRPKIFSLKKLKELKKILDEVIHKINFTKKDVFIMLGDVKAYEPFYLAQNLTKKGDVYYKFPDGRTERYIHPKYKPIYLRGEITRNAFRNIMDLDLIYYRGDEKSPCLGISDEWLKKNKIKEFAPETPVEEQILSAVKKTKTSYKNFDNLIVDQGSLENVLKIESVKKLYEKIFKLNLEFAFKKHPEPVKHIKQGSLISLFEKNCQEAPQYIPVELFYNNIKNCVLSLFSTSLVTASKLDHVKAVSLLELVEWVDDKYRVEWRKRLGKLSGEKILFPNKFEELEKILLNK